MISLSHKIFGVIGSILNPLVGKISEDTRKKGKGAKTGAAHNWRSFYLSQYDWLKGSHMTKVVWLSKKTDYSYCESVAPNTPILTPTVPKLDTSIDFFLKCSTFTHIFVKSGN